MKRIFLFLLTNIAVVLTLGIIANIFGLNRYLQGTGLNVGVLLVFSAFMGFTGSIISLLVSKKMAVWSTGAHIIVSPQNETEQWLVSRVKGFSDLAGIGMPDVAIYDSPEPNAFATGAFKNHALVAVSTGLLENMTHTEVSGVIAHEITHISNGDMITMTLMQGVVNTFTIFLARVIGFIVDRVILKNENNVGMAYYVIVFVSELVLTLFGSILVMWFSRHREYRADEGGAKLATPSFMIQALERLRTLSEPENEGLPKTIAAFGISGKDTMLALFSTHPPLEKRIKHLQDIS